MPRIPNVNDAVGMWDVTRPNQQRNAAYGERWPVTYIQPPAWSGTRYFSYCGFNGSNQSGYYINNSRTLGTAWTFPLAGMWASAQYAYTGKQSNGTRFLNSSGETSSGWSNVIEYVTCSTLGNAAYFGDAVVYTKGGRGGSNGTIGIYAGGNQLSGGSSSNTDIKRYVTISTTSAGASYGNLTTNRYRAGSASGATYFCMFGGYPYGTGGGNGDKWDYVTFVSSGSSINAGDMENVGSPRFNTDCDAIDGGIGSSRIVLAGGAWQNGGHSNAMWHFSTASFGYGTDYGNMASAKEANSTTGDGQYGIIAGGQGPTAYETSSLIFNVTTLSLAVVSPSSLIHGVTRNGMAAGNQ